MLDAFMLSVGILLPVGWIWHNWEKNRGRKNDDDDDDDDDNDNWEPDIKPKPIDDGLELEEKIKEKVLQ